METSMEFLYKNFYASFGLIICIFLLVNCSETNDTDKELALINEPPPLETELASNHDYQSKGTDEKTEVKPRYIIFASIVSPSEGKTELIEYKERRFISQKECYRYMHDNPYKVSDTLDAFIKKSKKGYRLLLMGCDDILNFAGGTHS